MKLVKQKIVVVLLLLWALMPSLFAQSVQFPFRSEENSFLSPLELRYLTIRDQSHDKVGQPLKLILGRLDSDKQKGSITTSYALGGIKGDYKPYEGNRFGDWQIMGDGKMDVKNFGQFSGFIAYARGEHQGVGWSGIRMAEVYLPYIAADSSGGDYHYEQYALLGAYKHHIKGVPIGLSFSYQGELAYRLTDPRAANTIGSFEINGSALFPFRGRQLAVSLGYLNDRQYVNLRNWRPAQQDKFFVTYGFGQVDVMNSPIWFGYSRMNFINGVQLSMALLPQSHLTGLSAEIDYQAYQLKTEETSKVNLYGALNQRLRGLVKQESRRWQLQAEAKMTLRDGREKMYEDYRPDEEYVSIYDLRLISTRKRYHLRELEAEAQALYRLFPDGASQVDLTVGAQFYDWQEWYDGSNYRIRNMHATPFAGFALALNKQVKCRFSLIGAYRVSMMNRYSLRPMQRDQIDYQLAYLPYAYRSHEGMELRAALSLESAVYKQHRVRLTMSGLYVASARPAGFKRYGRQPITVSGVLSDPSRELTSGSIMWGKVALKYLF